MSFFEHITEAPPDPILSTTQNFNADTDSRKVNLGVGAYRDENGKPYVLKVVREAEAEMLEELGSTINKEYTTIDGPPELKGLTQKLLWGDDNEATAAGRIASAQALSGTGALRVAAEFVMTHMSVAGKEVWLSDPTWGNHDSIFAKAGFVVKKYPYWHAPTKSLDIEGMLAALQSAPDGAMVLLHACAHNPTGVDPTEEQWKQIADLMKAKKFITLMDSAYQGYGSGSLDKDAFAARLFLSRGFEFLMCQSFAKNLGLYGERIGMLHVVCNTAALAKTVLSQLKMVIRPMYSSPPKHGAELVIRILGKPERFQHWKEELKGMADRILEVRSMLCKGLEDKGTPGTWNHITDQIGMFSFTGLTVAQCERLTQEHHIYLLKSGRISLAGLNKSNVQYMVDSVDEVVRSCP